MTYHHLANRICIVVAVLTLAIAGCGNPLLCQRRPPTNAPAGDALRGEQLFNNQIETQYLCNACHSLEAGKVFVGPSLAGVATSAAQRVAGYTAEQYLRESIVQPNAHIVEGYVAGVMPTNIGYQMPAQDLSDLVAYLLTLR
jgi:cytochrome c2